MQNLEFTTHHAGTGTHAAGGEDRIAQFFQRGIRLLSHSRPNDGRIRFEGAVGSAGEGVRCEVASFTPTPPPVLDRAQADLKMLGDLRLRKLALLDHGNHAFPQIE